MIGKGRKSAMRTLRRKVLRKWAKRIGVLPAVFMAAKQMVEYRKELKATFIESFASKEPKQDA